MTEYSQKIADLEAKNETLREALQSALAILPKYTLKGDTAADDEALDAVIEQITEALEPRS